MNPLDEAILSVEGVSKSYARRRVVDRATFSERRGQILGLVGPNGAGKTTLIRIVMGILTPEEGAVHVLGACSAAEARTRIGYLPEERGLYQKQPVRDVLRYLARLKGVPRRTADARMGDWLERLGLPDVLGRKVKELSKGMQQKVQFTAAVLHEPDLLLLDEPFAGLDPVSRQQLRAIIQEQAAGGKTVLLSSHEMAEVELLCPQVVMIHLGQIVLSGTVAAIKQDYSEHAVILGIRATAGLSSRVLGLGTVGQADRGTEAAPGASDLTAIPGVLRVEPHNARVKVLLDRGCTPSDFLARAVAAGAIIDHFEIALPSLEEVFVRIVKRETQ